MTDTRIWPANARNWFMRQLQQMLCSRPTGTPIDVLTPLDVYEQDNEVLEPGEKL